MFVNGDDNIRAIDCSTKKVGQHALSRPVSYPCSYLNGILMFLACAADATGLSEFYIGLLILQRAVLSLFFKIKPQLLGQKMLLSFPTVDSICLSCKLRLALAHWCLH